MQPSIDPSLPFSVFMGSLSRVGLEGLYLGSGLSEEATGWDCLTHLPSGFERAVCGDDLSEWVERRRVTRAIRERLELPFELTSEIALIMGAVHVESTGTDHGTKLVIRQHDGVDVEVPSEHDTTSLRPDGVMRGMEVGDQVVAATIIYDQISAERVRGQVLAWVVGEPPIVVPDYGLGLGANLIRSWLVDMISGNVILEPLDEQASATMRRDIQRVHGSCDGDPASDPGLALELLRAIRDGFGASVIFEPWRWELDLPPEEVAAGSDDLWKTGTIPTLPPARLVKNARAAEEYAAEVMRAVGFTDARATAGGADGGIDVDSSLGVAQVKMEALATTRPTVQMLFGVATVEGKFPLFFSLAGYTAQALVWAERAGVACFEFEFDGGIKALTLNARQLLATGRTDPSQES